MSPRLWIFLSLCLSIGGVTRAADAPPSARAIPVTVTPAVTRDIEVWEASVGQLEALTSPLIAAEVGGRIVAVTADVGRRVAAGQPLAEIDPEDFRLARALALADIDRLQALLRAQALQVKRLRALVRKQSAQRSSLDDAEAQWGALRAQLRAARVRLQQAERRIAKAHITSPIAGKVDERRISVGDYVKVGTPLFRVTALDRLRVRLPFPESLAGRLHRDLPVRLSTPLAPGTRVAGRISDLRPEITPGNRAIQVLVDLDNPGGWEPGASIDGAVRLALHENAVVVPEAAVVRRPAGNVVYVIRERRARQRKIRTGLRRNGEVEVVEGLAAGEPVAVDGAGFLSDGAAVEIGPP